jgi:hypothetical protein
MKLLDFLYGEWGVLTYKKLKKLTYKLASMLANIFTQTRNLPHVAIALRPH